MNDRLKGDRKSSLYLDVSKLHPKLFELIRQMQTQSWMIQSFPIKRTREGKKNTSCTMYIHLRYSNNYCMYFSEVSRKLELTLAPPIAMGK